MNDRLIIKFVIYRSIVATTLFLAALIIQFINFFVLPIDFLFYLTAFIYFLNIIYLVLKKFISVKANLYLQLFGDILLESTIVYLTGSLTGSFSFLYLITILVASFYLYKKGALIIASISAILYGLLVDLQYYGLIPSFYYQPFLPIGRIYYNLISNFLGFFIVALLGSFISERLRKANEVISSTEEELKKKEKMATIGAMSQAIAHEIRNPLASISGSVQLLKDRVFDEKDNMLIKIIAQETFRLTRIIENFLLFAKPKPINKFKFSLSQQLKDFFVLLQNSPEKEPHEVFLELPEEEIIINADRDMLQQVLWNLVRNGFKAMGAKKGKLTIRAKKNNNISIEVEDTGHGISKERENIIFEPFSSNFQEGLGIGLALCKRIISEHNGKIQVKSFEKEKTIFEVILPNE